MAAVFGFMSVNESEGINFWHDYSVDMTIFFDYSINYDAFRCFIS